MKVYRVSIYLADTQWGNEAMAREAKAYYLAFVRARIASNAPPADLVIEVHEHGGWFLTYYCDPRRRDPIIIGSANDGAQWSAAQQNIRNELASAEWDWLPECRNKGGGQ